MNRYLSYKMVDVSHRVDSELGRDPFQLLWAEELPESSRRDSSTWVAGK